MDKNPKRRTVQRFVIDTWKESGLSRADVVRRMPNINPHALRCYLNGDESVFLRERTIEELLENVIVATKK